MDIKWKIESWWNNITTCWYNIKYGIPNFWRWRKIIWNDRDWDQHFLYEVMEFKLRNMADLHRNYGHGVYAERYAKQMETCAALLKRIKEDEYHDNAFIHHDRKYGELEMWGTPTDNPELTLCNFNRKKICNTNDYEQEEKDSRRLYKHVERMTKQDIEYCFKLMAKHIRGWWD